MKCIHVSESFNKDSIMKHGLLPTKIQLPQHLQTFQECDICTKDGKILYTWESCDKDTKFVKDMVFCKMFIQPRNAWPEKHWPDFSKLSNKFLGKHDSMTYDIYELTVPTKKSDFYHVQEPVLDKHNPCFDIPFEFAHDDKHLQLFKDPQKNLRIIGTAEFEYDKNNKYVVRVK